jgi:murein L,D-transpeptidase YafK
VQEVLTLNGVVRWFAVAGALLVLCAPARGAAGEMLASVSSGSNGSDGYVGYPVIEIWKEQRKLQLRQGDALLGEFRVMLGQQPRDGKQVQGDGRTPVGRYYISDKNPDSRFHRFLGISYPNEFDADRGYRKGLIGVDQWADIFLANLRGDAPPSYTVLGGRIGIHGSGGRPDVPIDWTEGCIAVSDEEIEYIFQRVPVGTPVIINE